MKSPITILMSALVVLLVSTLCLLSYADMEKLHRRVKYDEPTIQHPVSQPESLPDNTPTHQKNHSKQMDESDPPCNELTIRLIPFHHQIS